MKLILSLLFISCLAKSVEFTGRAYDLKTDQLLYIEKIKTQDDADGFNTLIEVDYLDADEKSFAKIRSDLSKNKFIPDVIFEDARNQIKDEQSFSAEKKEVLFKRTYLKTSKEKQRNFKIEKNMLGGQGFNNFLLARFAELLEGKSIHVNFIVLASQDYFQFDIKKIGDVRDGQVTFGLKVSSYFLKMFVKEIQVTYDVEKKRLMSFSGLSNLLDKTGEPMKVRITYEYAK